MGVTKKAVELGISCHHVRITKSLSLGRYHIASRFHTTLSGHLETDFFVVDFFFACVFLGSAFTVI